MSNQSLRMNVLSQAPGQRIKAVLCSRFPCPSIRTECATLSFPLGHAGFRPPSRGLTIRPAMRAARYISVSPAEAVSELVSVEYAYGQSDPTLICCPPGSSHTCRVEDLFMCQSDPAVIVSKYMAYFVAAEEQACLFTFVMKLSILGCRQGSAEFGMTTVVVLMVCSH